MKIKSLSIVTLTFALSFAALESHARAKPAEDELQQGAEDFRAHCASCHGTDARGQGPVAPFLVRKPTDLTTLASRNDGEFPIDAVYWIIDGRGEVAAHGPRDMPVWGEQFGNRDVSETEKRERILNIIAYLQTLQRNIPANPVPR
jgi:mono/diheme cytochrome c family protein